jgi:RimJ/RimL family protein N-acetyltransferase
MPEPRLRALSGRADEIAALQRVVDGAAAYYLLCAGSPAGPSEATDLWQELPPGRSREHKLLCGIEVDGDWVGCADVIRGYPEEHVAFVGLLLLRDDARGRGIGRAAYEAIERLLREQWPEIRRLRLAVLVQNEAGRRFWERAGFAATGERKPHRMGVLASEVDLFEKPLAAGGR